MWVASALGVGGSILAGSVLGAGATAYAANTAASAQTAAAQKAQDTALGMYNTTRGDLQPFRNAGVQAGTELSNRLGEFTTPINMDEATLEQTPGYQFDRTQGLKAVQNSAAARGLGVSGAALKGAANFATGLADNTYKTQFDIANTNQSNAFNRLKSLVDTGENAAAQTGVIGNAAATTAATAQTAVGSAQAAAANQTGAGITNAANNLSGYAMYKGLYGTGGSAPGAPGNYGGSPSNNPNLEPIG